MPNNPTDKQKMLDALMRKTNGAVDRGSIEAAMNGDTNALLNRLNNSDKAKIQNMLNDKEALQKLLSSAAAQKLIKKISGKDTN